MPLSLNELVSYARERDASDIHLVCGIEPRCRIDGAVVNITDEKLSYDDCAYYAKALCGEDFEKIEDMGEWDGAADISGVRCRINVFRQRSGISTALRLLKGDIPDLAGLGLPPAVTRLPELLSGIVLVTGVTGSGKSTTLSAMLDTINHSRQAHIITLEDPIEYVYEPDRCIINQREVGRDTESYSSGLRAVLREDPDVILIGEMRDLDTIRTALTAAETGHIVFATLHTGTAADAVDRIVDVFPEGEQKQIRMQLSITLQAVISQKLIPSLRGGRVAACEVMVVTPAIRNLIREGKTPQISNAIMTSSAEGSITMDNCLIKLYREKKISGQMARLYARDEAYVKKSTVV